MTCPDCTWKIAQKFIKEIGYLHHFNLSMWPAAGKSCSTPGCTFKSDIKRQQTGNNMRLFFTFSLKHYIAKTFIRSFALLIIASHKCWFWITSKHKSCAKTHWVEDLMTVYSLYRFVVNVFFLNLSVLSQLMFSSKSEIKEQNLIQPKHCKMSSAV